MDVLLVGGCAAAGAVSGVVFDALGAAVPPAKRHVAHEPLEEGAEPPSGGEADTVPDEALAPPTVFERVAVVAASALLFGLAADRLGAAPELAAYVVLFAGLVVLSVADIRVGLVPRKFLYPTLALVVVALVAASAVTHHWQALLDAAIGGAAGFAVFFTIWFFAPRAMGFGDVRLAGLVGLSLGWIGFRVVYIGFLVAFVAGSVIGVAKMVASGTGRKTTLPFGPALAIGAVVGVLWGPYVANLWLHPGG